MSCKMRVRVACAHVEPSFRLGCQPNARRSTVKAAQAQRKVIETIDSEETLHTMTDNGQWQHHTSQVGGGSKRAFDGLQGLSSLMQHLRLWPCGVIRFDKRSRASNVTVHIDTRPYLVCRRSHAAYRIDHEMHLSAQPYHGTPCAGFFLPNGYPHAISPDYVPYQLWTLPTHITGWIGSSLVTSSLLKAAGLGTGAVGTVAAGATIKWIAKDGIGALGRYIVGGSLARYFDEDPRFWRFLADLVVRTTHIRTTQVVD